MIHPSGAGAITKNSWGPCCTWWIWIRAAVRASGARLAARRPRRRISNDQFMIEQMPRDALRPAVAPRFEPDDQIGGDSGHRRDRLGPRRQLPPKKPGKGGLARTTPPPRA